ncbi:MAG TPA: HEAT repeat domain-containing protein [Phycisphaerales bacterium]|nr:HEAT repeat domain-containing protein [Phycisphaerales bacterium]
MNSFKTFLPRIAFSVGLLCAMAGCDTIGQDIADLKNSITPISPHEAALKAADKNDPDARRTGTTLISNSPFGGADAYLALYREYVQHDDDPLVKASAIRALARHGTPDDALLIVPHLTDENPQVRWEAAKALQRLHNPAVVADALKVIRNEEEQSDIRVAAIQALGQYPEDRVFRGLVGRLDERELSINLSAQDTLHTLTNQQFGLNSREWLQWYESKLKGGDPFADQQEYLFPTYQRDESFWERVAFWTSPTFEQPGTPTGLHPAGSRTTYDDEPPAASIPSGG